MNILFVHQSFPGQYRHILRQLSHLGVHRLVGLGISALSEALPPGVAYVRYALNRGNADGLHPWLVDFDSKVIRGEACAKAAMQLLAKGFKPDLICAHSGWGEALFLRDVFPDVPILSYQEFFYNSIGFDSDFDPEFQDSSDWLSGSRLRLKNVNPLLMLDASTWNVTPTFFQRSTFPSVYLPRISVIHDGIDTELASPDSSAKDILLPDGTILSRNQDIVTFVNRSVEPYRGCHIFIRSIPEILAKNSNVHIVIVGHTSGVSYGPAAPGDRWGDIFLREIAGHYDVSRVHFTGALEYHDYLHLLKLSSCHVYLTYPFVLSWSLLEAMSIGLPVVSSSTPPVLEVIDHDVNGYLIDFFSISELVNSVTSLLNDKSTSKRLGLCARQSVLDNFERVACVNRHISLMESVAKGEFE